MAAQYNRKDSYYEKAKSSGYRSRAAFKLIELNNKFHFLKSGVTVLDLGCWPGGWMQVAAQKVGRSGKVVGVDLVETDPFSEDWVQLVTGDARDEEVQVKLLEAGGGRFDVVLSDMSPKLTGIREVDFAATGGCADLALWVAQRMLNEGGTLIIKLFKSPDADQFVKTSRPLFNKVQRIELEATRRTSNEFYFVGTGFHISK